MIIPCFQGQNPAYRPSAILLSLECFDTAAPLSVAIACLLTNWSVRFLGAVIAHIYNRDVQLLISGKRESLLNLHELAMNFSQFAVDLS